MMGRDFLTYVIGMVITCLLLSFISLFVFPWTDDMYNEVLIAILIGGSSPMGGAFAVWLKVKRELRHHNDCN